MKYFLLLVSLFLIIGCNSKTKKINNELTELEKDSLRITAKDIKNLKYTEYVLGPDAKEALVNWQRYQELSAQIEFLKQGDLSFFGGKNELLLGFLKDLMNDIPLTLATPAIKERLIALETKILKLHNTLELSNVSKNENLENIKEVLVASSNFYLQINKKFELDSQLIEDPTLID